MITRKQFAVVLIAMPLAFAYSCSKNKTGNPPDNYLSTTAYNLQNISYGSHSQQIMDMYLPANRNSTSTKVFVLIHGGGWTAGDKSENANIYNTLKTYFPNHAIVNMNYQLGTSSSAGYPKQITDIKAALNEIQKDKYGLSNQFLLFGSSAGGHLSMLYAYRFDSSKQVKAVINMVGPADLTDPAYANNMVYMGVVAGLIGNSAFAYAQNVSLFNEVSPAKQATPQSPPTLSFYGDQDPLIPSTQLGLLRNALNAKGVFHTDTLYPGGGHGIWATQAQNQDCIEKTVAFINQFFK